jgi:hypothetical protein
MKPAFGLFDYTMLPKLNRILKPFGLRLKQRSNSRQWGDQVEITVEVLKPEPPKPMKDWKMQGN